MSASLSVSVVTFKPDFAELGNTLRTLREALDRARAAGSLGEASLSLVDNDPGTDTRRRLEDLLGREFVNADAARAVVSGQGNVGYGRGHNLALLASRADYHLVLNPDVELAREAIQEALGYMASHPEVVILAPDAHDAAGERLFLCKRYPAVLDLALRGFAPSWLRRRWRARLDRYEMRDLPRIGPSQDVPILSGSFMFCRRPAIAAIGGFADAFFLYFEDFDLSLRAARQGRLALVPTVRIVHRGGHAAAKGTRHVTLFVRSAMTFFNRHGWKWV